jgi:uncharacterized BrkB/YihY/UPF0761 family membrane protein
MSVLMLPVRLAGMLVCWIAAVATVMSLEVASSGGHPPASWLIGGPLLALLSGVVLGAIYWRASSRKPFKSLGLPVGLLAAFAVVAIGGGAQVGR